MARQKPKKQRRVMVSSLLVLGEGVHDKAFLNHMKELYDGRQNGQTVKIASADGGSPYDIVNAVLKQREADYDRRFVFMDSDVEISKKARDLADRNKIAIILSTPVCLEGMLLEVLGKNSPDNSQDCKARLHPMLCGCPTLKESYRGRFPKNILDATEKEAIVELRQLLANTA